MTRYRGSWFGLLFFLFFAGIQASHADVLSGADIQLHGGSLVPGTSTSLSSASGTIQLQGSTLSVLGAGYSSGSSGIQLHVGAAPVPEPSGLWQMASGLLLLAALMRRRCGLRRETSRKRWAAVVALLAIGNLAGPAWSQVPHDMTYQGQLTDSVGAPLSGPVDLELRIFDVISGGSPLYAEDHTAIVLGSDGGFSVQLGGGVASIGSFDPALFSGVNRYLEVMVEAEVLTPRQVLASVPWALVAEEASRLQGVDVTAELGALYSSVVAAQSSADDAQNDATAAQSAAAANASAVSGNDADLAAIENELGGWSEGPTVSEAVGGLEKIAVADNDQIDVPLGVSGSPISSAFLMLSPWLELPMFTYRRPDSGDLMLGYCHEAAPFWDCFTGIQSTAVENGEDTGDLYSNLLTGYNYPMAAGADGSPLIVHMFRETNPPGPGPESWDTLKIIYCDDILTCFFGETTNIDYSEIDSSAGISEEIGGVDIVIGSDGLPILSYYKSEASWDPWDFDNPNYSAQTKLKVVHCQNVACTVSTTSTIHTSSSQIHLANTSIAIGADGRARISFHDDAGDDLMIARCADVACSSASISTLDSSGDVGRFSSIALGEGDIPIVSYYDDTQDDLKVARCKNSSCTSTTVSTIDSGGNVGSRNFIEISGCGLPVVGYYDATNTSVKVARCVDSSCENALVSVVDSAGDVGAGLSMALQSSGTVMLSYFDSGSGHLKIASSEAGYLWDAVCQAHQAATSAQTTADSADATASDAQAAAETAQAAADAATAAAEAAQAAADSILGGCGTLVPAAICPVGEADGPRCDTVLPGAFCEGDGECGTSASTDNCGVFDWYFKVSD